MRCVMSDDFYQVSIPFYVTKASNILKLRIQRAFKENGFNITSDQWGVLNILWKKDGQPQKEIAKKVFKDNSNLTRILDLLEKENLIERRRHESDRRSYRIFLTLKGKNIKNKLIPIVYKSHEISLKDLSERKRNELIDMLNLICNND